MVTRLAGVALYLNVLGVGLLLAGPPNRWLLAAGIVLVLAPILVVVAALTTKGD